MSAIEKPFGEPVENHPQNPDSQHDETPSDGRTPFRSTVSNQFLLPIQFNSWIDLCRIRVGVLVDYHLIFLAEIDVLDIRFDWIVSFVLFMMYSFCFQDGNWRIISVDFKNKNLTLIRFDWFITSRRFDWINCFRRHFVADWLWQSIGSSFPSIFLLITTCRKARDYSIEGQYANVYLLFFVYYLFRLLVVNNNLTKYTDVSNTFLSI